MATSLPFLAGLPLDAASWAQTPLVVRQLIAHLLAVIEQQAGRIAALEARVSQTSRNSDRPPSSDPPYVSRTARSATLGRPGAKRGHPGHRQSLLVPTEVLEVKPTRCDCGQREFPAVTSYYTHQQIELPAFQMVVRHVVLHETRCPGCGHRLKAVLPAEYRYGYGPRLTALIGELSGPQWSSRGAVQEFCASVLGVPISRGAVQRAVNRVSDAITPHYEAIAEKARAAPVNYIDETTWYQHGVLAWLWVMASTTVAFFKVQASRSKAAFAELIERWAGILVSDGYGVYCQWMHARQTCLAHLIRRARGLSERKEPELARFGRRVMTELQRIVHWATAPPTRGEVQTWYARTVGLIGQYHLRGDEAGTFARTLDREMGPCGRLPWRKGWSPPITGPSGRCGRPAGSEASPRSPS